MEQPDDEYHIINSAAAGAGGRICIVCIHGVHGGLEAHHACRMAPPARPRPPARRPAALRFFLAGERVSQSADAAHYFGGEMGDLNWST